MPKFNAESIMTSPAFSVSPEEDLWNLIGKMLEKGIGSVTVVDGKRPIGIFSERDVMKAVNQGIDLAQGEVVRNFMTPNPVIVEKEVHVKEIMEMMIDKNFRHLPVVSDGKLVGIISMKDVVKAQLEFFQSK